MTKIKESLSKNTNRSTNSRATRINTRLFLSSNVELVDRTNVKRINPSLVLNKILDNLNKAVHHLILARRYPLAAADGMDYEGLVNLDKSTTPVSFNGKVYVGSNYLPLEVSYSQDNKSNLEHKQALNVFILNQEQLRKEDEIKLTVELLNNPYNPIGWIPGLRSVVNAGADLNYSRTHNTASTPYTADAAFSTAGDAITLGFGLGPLKNYAGSYAGTVAGGLIGELFDNPLLGLIIGGITGGFSPLIYNTSKEFLSNKFDPYLLARTMDSSLKSALIPPELYPIRTDFNFGKGSGRILRADKGDARGIFTGHGAYIQNGFLYPGKARMEGLRDFTWWNEDELFSTRSNKEPHLRVFIANKSDIPGLLRVREMNEAVGQWKPGRKSFVRKSEMVTSEPIDISNLTLYNYDPNLGIYVRSDVQTHNLSPSLPNPLNTPKTNYSLYERPSKLTSTEKAGIPRGERNNTSKPLTDFGLMEVIDNTYLASPSLTNYIGGGGESWVYSDLDRIYKVMRSPLVGLSGYNNFNLNGFSKERIGDFIRLYINPRNRHPIFEPIQFEGIVHLDDLVFPVVSLRRLTTFPSAIPGELVRRVGELFQQLMNKHGYKQVFDLFGGFGRGYRNNLGTISDVSFRNLGYTPEGELRMIDMLAEKKGGKLNLKQ